MPGLPNRSGKKITPEKAKIVLERAVRAAREHKLIFIDESVAYTGININTFYKLKLHENEELKAILLDNRISEKVKLRGKWRKSKAPALNIALYKLCANDEERNKLSDRTYVSLDESQSKTLNIKFI